jgi:type IV pilus assembly protein PilP
VVAATIVLTTAEVRAQGTPPPPAAALAPAAPQDAAGQPSNPAAQPTAPAPAESYTYSPDGRRDPFLSLLGTGVEGRNSNAREGLAGIAVGEISVRGIVQSRGMLIAMVQGPDNRTYMVHQGDRLLDGSVQAITPEALVIVQEVNDPLSLVKQRTIRKPLRSLEDVKQ